MTQAGITDKIIIQGKLVLDAPLLIGDGGIDDTNQRDVHVLKNRAGVPFIPGTSLAGVLRAYMEEIEPEGAQLLFGTGQQAETEMQSALSLEDVELKNGQIVFRDGVQIDPATGVTVKHHKFDYEAVDAGASGSFYLEITLREIHKRNRDGIKQRVIEPLEQVLAAGFHAGALTTKGFGRVHVAEGTVDWYDFHKPADVRAWLAFGTPDIASGHTILEAREPQNRKYPPQDFVVEADFALLHSLIVRDQDEEKREQAEMKLAETKRSEESDANTKTSIASVMKTNGKGDYVIPGTSLKGVLRHRAEYILQALHKPEAERKALLEVMGTTERRSRFYVEEAVFKDGVKPKAQTRVRLDRFTGGTIHNALFTTLPVWQGVPHEKVLTLRFGIKEAKQNEAGLALLLLKDLWLGRTALGGEKSIGRGVLEGLTAKFSYQGETWKLCRGESVPGGQAQQLQTFVDALVKEAQDGQSD